MARPADKERTPTDGLEGPTPDAAAPPDHGYRVEKDFIGKREIPKDALFGIHSLRAKDNFDITGIRLDSFPLYIESLAMVKQAAVRANLRVGAIDDEAKGRAIDKACAQVIAGRWHDQFIVDMLQGGAGTSTNMNMNEVLANLALKELGEAYGKYELCHPNDDVNCSQSTNDALPTGARVATVFFSQKLRAELEKLEATLRERSEKFAAIYKMGRTHLQDAVPMTLGAQFGAWATSIQKEIQNLREVEGRMCQVNLGATAVGSRIAAEPGYAEAAIEELREITGLDVELADDLFEATSDSTDFVRFSGALNCLALRLSKMSDDLRLMSSGPRHGLGEIRLQEQQPGSSIMPGKVNPVIPEIVNQVCFQVDGHDRAIARAAAAAQLQLNVFGPVIAFNLFQSLKFLTKAVIALASKCIPSIEADPDLGKDVDQSPAMATGLLTTLGYDLSSKIAKISKRTGLSPKDLLLNEALREDNEELLSDAKSLRDKIRAAAEKAGLPMVQLLLTGQLQLDDGRVLKEIAELRQEIQRHLADEALSQEQAREALQEALSLERITGRNRSR